MGWGRGGRIGSMERKRGRGEGGGEVYSSAVCCCGGYWEHGASLPFFSWDQHGLMARGWRNVEKRPTLVFFFQRSA